MSHHDAPDREPVPGTDVDPATHWEARYADADRVWSGRVNAVLRDVVESLAASGDLVPGRALELGSGEGGDAVWLARAGWRVTAVDISPTATRRGAEAATAAGVPADRIRWIAADLGAGLDAIVGPESFELVTASFLQSSVELPRTAILRDAAAHVAPGGRLLVVAHAAPPPWARHAHGGEHAHGHDDGKVSPKAEVAELELDAGWIVEIAEVRSRVATGPDGVEAELEDSVVLVRRE